LSQDIFELPPPPADHRVAYGDDPDQFGELRIPAGAGPHPVAMVVHGGFWREYRTLNHTAHLCAALRKHGIATWNVEYRRLEHADGGWPGTCMDMLSAAHKLVALGREHHFDMTRLILIGYSAGGHLALWLAAQPDRPRLSGVISLAGVADLRRAYELKLGGNVVDEFLPQPERDLPFASPIELLPTGMRTRLIHGTSDETVPIEISRHYCEAAVHAGDDSKLIEISGANHRDVVDPRSTYWPSVEAEIRALLGS
jgi:acetyl esterase/lipase